MSDTPQPQRNWRRTLWSWCWKLGLAGAVLLAAVLFYLHTEVQKHFLGAEWTEPVSVYGVTVIAMPRLALSCWISRAPLNGRAIFSPRPTANAARD